MIGQVVVMRIDHGVPRRRHNFHMSQVVIFWDDFVVIVRKIRNLLKSRLASEGTERMHLSENYQVGLPQNTPS